MRLIGKSTLLQALGLNLTKANTQEQVQLNLLDFCNNGLLPLKELSHAADIVTLEKTEKDRKYSAHGYHVRLDRHQLI